MTLTEILQEKDLFVLKEMLDSIHPYDIAKSFLELSDTLKTTLSNNLSGEKLAEVLAHLEDEDAANLLIDLAKPIQKEVIANLDLDDAADIILELDNKEKKEIIALFPDDEKQKITSLLAYEENETGAHMSSSLVVVNINDEIKTATKKLISDAPDAESIRTVFVTDDHDQYIGTISLKKLLTTKSPSFIKDIVEVTPAAFDKADIELTVNQIRDFGFFEMPVTNSDGQLLGMITVDDALDILDDEKVENYEKLALLPDQELKMHFTKTAFHRLPWLLILLFLTIPIAFITSGFEELLAKMVVLMVFQPLILDASGDAATQTLAIMLKLIADGKKTLKKNTVREILSGIINGFLIGLIAASLAFLLTKLDISLVDNNANSFNMAIIIGISLWLTLILATMVAIAVPLVLKKIKIDPAVASGPFITTIIDILALFIYLGLASIMLGGAL